MIKTRWNIQLTGMFFAHRVSHNKAHHLWAGEVLSCDTCLRPHCTLSHHHFWWGGGKEKCKFSLPDTVGLYAFNPRNRKQYSKEDDHSQKKMILFRLQNSSRYRAMSTPQKDGIEEGALHQIPWIKNVVAHFGKAKSQWTFAIIAD